MRIELGADEVVVVPEDGIALLGTPLVVAEDAHGDARPLLAADRAHLAHGDAEGAVACEAHARGVGVADLGADDRGEAVAARTEQAGREVFAAHLEGRVGIADRAVVADVGRYDGVLRQPGLDGAPRLTRRHAIRIARARVRVPRGARIVVLVVHAGQRLQPGGLGRVDERLALRATRVAGRRRQLRQDLLGDELGVAADADGDGLGQADAVRVDVDLDDLGGLGPVVDAVAWQCRERVEARAEAQHHVSLGHEFHRGLRAVVAEGADGERMAAGEAVVVLVVVAHRRIELLCQRRRLGNRAREHDARARQDLSLIHI